MRWCIRGHIHLQQQQSVQALTHCRIGEGVALHLLARHAPVGIEIQHHRFVLGGDTQLLRQLIEIIDTHELHRWCRGR